MIKLHLGCGNKIIDGYVNIDCRHLPGVDRVEDITILRNYKNESVDIIYACHVLEHFSRWKFKYVLQRWYELLKPNGILRISVPDFDKVVKAYNNGSTLSSLMGFLHGGQDYAENYHYVSFNFNTINEVLSDIGFKKIYEYDWRKTEHSHIDDFSQAYIPHMDKDNGLLMSLNVEAIK